MTKEQLQKEMLEKVKPGIKPSQLKKLKRSKSAGDIAESEKGLETKISVLNLELEVKNRELLEKDGTITVYSEQLKEKQTEIENLREQLETTNQKLTETTQELDNSLVARQQSLKD
jgi:chromosome segregation ATPase